MFVFFLWCLCFHMLCVFHWIYRMSLYLDICKITGGAGLDVKGCDVLSDVGRSHGSPGGRESRWKLSRLLLCTQQLHHKLLVGGEMLSASACGQIVLGFFSFFLSLYISLFLLKEMRGSIDWEDRRPLCGQKARLCRAEIFRNNQIPPLLLLFSQWDFRLP